jgi:anti-anti-sigma factor
MIPRTSEPARGSKTPEPATDCQWSRQGGQYVVEVRGELDMAAVQDHGLTTALNAYRSGEPLDVVLDLGEVTFIDSAGLSWLMSVRSTATLADRRLRVRRSSPAVHKVLEMAGLLKYFAPSETVAATSPSSTGAEHDDRPSPAPA